jgi:hypothetical protein
VRLGARESKEDWVELGRDLIARGLAAPRLVVADGAPGLISAVEELWPRADRQHCAVHRLRNLLAKVPKEEHDRIRFNYWSALTDATGVKDGKLRLQVLISELDHRGYESAARCLSEDLDALVVHLRYPLGHRERWRATDESVKGWSGRCGLFLGDGRSSVVFGGAADRFRWLPFRGRRSCNPDFGRVEASSRGDVVLRGVSARVTLPRGRGRPRSEAQDLGLRPAAQLAPLRAFEVASHWRRPRPASASVRWLASRQRAGDMRARLARRARARAGGPL